MDKFTVFFGEFGFLLSGNIPDAGLQGLIDAGAESGMEPVSWMLGDPFRSPQSETELRAESIAAGRLIELRDGKYIPLGVTEESPDTEFHRAVDRLAGVVAEEAKPTESGSLIPVPAIWQARKTAEKVRPALSWATPKPFDPWKGFFTKPADMADWQDTYYPS